MAHAIACYDRETGKLECCCEQMDGPELLREHQHPDFLYDCPVCGNDVTFAHQWCPKCLRDALG